MPNDTYFRPSRLQDALSIRAAHAGGLCVAAGCTDLFPATERKILPGSVLDITEVDGLRGLQTTSEGIRIGAGTTWREIFRAELPPACRALQQAAAQVGARQIQNRGTLGGNLCNASPAADGVPPLLCLNAQVELQSLRGTRMVPLADFLHGVRETDLADDELMTAVLIPASALTGTSVFSKLGARSYLVISIVMVAARLAIEDGRVTDAALSVGACNAVAVRLPQIEAAIIGKKPDATLVTDALVEAAISPISDIRADSAYRRRAAVRVMRGAVSDLVGSAT